MNILQSSSAASLVPWEAANAPAQQAGGSFQGERVYYVPVSQSPVDVAEELIFVFSERAEKSLVKCRLGDVHAHLSEVQIILQGYWKRIPGPKSQQRLEVLIVHPGNGQLSSLAQLSAYLEGFFSEISQCPLTLSQMRDVLVGRPKARMMLTLIDQTLLWVADEQDLKVELGLRIEPLVAKTSAVDIGDIQAPRDTYRDAVLGYRGLSTIWRDTQVCFVATSPEQVMVSLQKVLNVDLDNQLSRLDPVRLEQAMSDMYKPHVLGGLAEQVGAFWQVLVTGGRGHGIRAF